MNKKEEVLDIKLTQYGKKLLSKGVFDPVYYSFHDEGILYDSSYASLQENQNHIQERIMENTPTLRTQHNFSSTTGSAGTIKIKKPDGKIEEIDISQIESRNSLGLALGNSEVNNQSLPSISIKMFDGEITYVDQSYTGSFGNKIPQIDCDIDALVEVRNISDAQKYENAFESAISTIAPDNTYLAVKSPNFLIEIIENNTEFNSENFEIEVFYDPDGENKPLSFANKRENSQIVNGIMVSDNPSDDDDNFVLPQQDNVEYYFSINSDDDILPDVLSAASAHFKSKGFYNDKSSMSVKKGTTLELSGIYSSTTDPDDIEDCR